MDSLVNSLDIQNYATKNTSGKMPIEQLYVQAFVDSILNSTALSDKIKTLKDEMQNGDAFVLFNSIDTMAKNINKEPYRSIVAYAMLKKDFRLFELISASMFTGTVVEYHGDDLYTEATQDTDEVPLKYTDSGIFTDMNIGRIQIGFKNIFTTDILPDGTGSEYQTLEELQDSLEEFDNLITLTKPARVGILLFYEPYCFVTGNKDEISIINMDITSSPFLDEESMNILDNMTDIELINLYRIVTHIRYTESSAINRDIDTTRHVIKGDGFITLEYEFRTNTPSSDETAWDTIIIQSDASSVTYTKTQWRGPEETYYEKYTPIMLALEDGHPEGPCLAFQIENDVCTVGAMFYVREKADE